MFRVTRYPMISKTDSGRVGYRKKYRVAGRVRVPAWHCMCSETDFTQEKSHFHSTSSIPNSSLLFAAALSQNNRIAD